jgi:fructose-1,6-bisphosphatase-3
MQQEFGIHRVVYGHTPIDYTKGVQMASRDGVAINVDGGFAEAYYNRGHSLVHTPHQLYGIILPTPGEIIEAERRLESAPLDIEPIDEFRQPMKIKDTIEGRTLKKQRDEIMAQIRKLARQNGLTAANSPHAED